MSDVIPCLPGTGMMFEQRERVIGMLTAGMSAGDIAQHFPRHKSLISQLLNKFQQTKNVADRPRSGLPLEDRFLRLHPDAIDFLLVES